MSSKCKLNGSNTARRLEEAARLLKMSVREFRGSVAAVIRAAGRDPKPRGPDDVVSADEILYVNVVLSGVRRLSYISGTGVTQENIARPTICT